jgi:hypothetical protein
MFNTIRDMHPNSIVMVISELGKRIWIGIKPYFFNASEGENENG